MAMVLGFVLGGFAADAQVGNVEGPGMWSPSFVSTSVAAGAYIIGVP